MLVNVNKVYSYIQSNNLEKKSELPTRTLSRCVCVHKRMNDNNGNQ